MAVAHVGVAKFGEETLQRGCLGEHGLQRGGVLAAHLDGDEIGMSGGQPGVIRAVQEHLGAQQIVVEETALRKAAAGLGKKSVGLRGRQRAPGGERDLEVAETLRAGEFDAFDHRAEREADHANHREGVGRHRGTERADNLGELPVGDRMAFAGGAEDIKVRGQVAAELFDRADKDVGVELEPVGPGNGAGAENDGGITLGGSHEPVCCAGAGHTRFV